MSDLNKLRTLTEAAKAEQGFAKWANADEFKWNCPRMTEPSADYLAALDPETVVALLDAADALGAMVRGHDCNCSLCAKGEEAHDRLTGYARGEVK